MISHLKNVITVLFIFVLMMVSTIAPSFATSGKDTIKVGFFPYDGFQSIEEDGTYNGYVYEYLQSISKYTGWKYQFVKSGWDTAAKQLESGEIDMMGIMMSTAQNRKVMGFSDYEMGSTYTSLVVRNDSGLLYDDYKGFDGMTVAVNSDALTQQLMSQFANENGFKVKYKVCNGIAEVYKALNRGNVDAAAITGYAPGENLRVVADFAPQSYYFVTAKNNTKLLSQLNRAMGELKISDPELQSRLQKKYITKEEAAISLTKGEKEYISKRKHALKILYINDLAPISTKNKDTGKVEGISKEIADKICENTGLRFSFEAVSSGSEAIKFLKEGKGDGILAFQHDYNTAEKNGLKISSSYLDMPLVLIKRQDSDKAPGITGVVDAFKDYSQVSALEDTKIQIYNSVEKCLNAVENGEIQQAVMNAYTASSYFRTGSYESLTRVTIQDDAASLCMAFPANCDNVLVSTVNKGISSIPQSYKTNLVVSSSFSNEQTLRSLLNQVPAEAFLIMALILLIVALLMAKLLIRRVRMSKELKHLLYSDSLTGAMSVKGFDDNAGKILENCKDRMFAIVDLDVNHFRNYNEVNGYEEGDKLILNIANVSMEDSGPNELVARVEGDHFVLLCCVNNIKEVIDRIKQKNKNLKLVARDRSVLISYGVYIVTDRKQSVPSMRDKALAAKNTIKDNYDEYYAVFDADIHEQQIEEQKLITSVDEAIKKQEFKMYLQPKYEVKHKSIIGAEMLVRWQRSDGKLIMPDKFIELFEKNGLIIKLDMHLLDQICCKLTEMKKANKNTYPISVNFSRIHLYDKKFVPRVVKVLDKYGLNHDMIEIELTETSFEINRTLIKETVEKFHDAGFKVAIDDFGSGFSSINTIKDIAFDEVKIDKKIIADIQDSEKSKAVFESIITLTNALGMRTVAEGVETEEQLDIIKALGGDMVQGFYFHRPVYCDSFFQFINGAKNE